MQSTAAMAHTSAFSGHCLQPPPQRLQVPQQLTSLRSPLMVQRQSGRCLQRAALVSDVAVPMPPAQPESPARRLRRTGSEGLDRAVQLLRSLSSKFTSAPEGVVQQVRRQLRKALSQSYIFKAAVAPAHSLFYATRLLQCIMGNSDSCAQRSRFALSINAGNHANLNIVSCSK